MLVKLPPPLYWPEAKGHGYSVYIGTSARLQDWAIANGQHYLFKVGRSSQLLSRTETLNGRAFWTQNIDSQPCLGFDDWELLPCMDFALPRPAREAENQVQKWLRRIFGAFDRQLLTGSRPSSNGETEIFRIRPDQLEDAVAYTGRAVTNGFVTPKVEAVVGAAVAEIARYRDAHKGR